MTRAERLKERYHNDAEFREGCKKIDRTYRQRHKEEIKARNKAWNETSGYNAKWRKLHPDYAKQKYQKTKTDVILHYAKFNPPCCEICGKLDRLSIDHIYGGGSKHRKELGTKGGYGFYLWLIRNNYPKGYRVLCMDCNRSIRWDTKN